MKKFNVFGFIFGLLVLSTSAQAQNIGDTATVPGWRWVDVANTRSVTQHFAGSDRELIYGDTCGIESGGTVDVIAVDDERLLLSYTAPSAQLGTPCPSGVVFFVSKDEFLGMTQKYDERVKEVGRDLDIVNKALGIEPKS